MAAGSPASISGNAPSVTRAGQVGDGTPGVSQSLPMSPGWIWRSISRRPEALVGFKLKAMLEKLAPEIDKQTLAPESHSASRAGSHGSFDSSYFGSSDWPAQPFLEAGARLRVRPAPRCRAKEACRSRRARTPGSSLDLPRGLVASSQCVTRAAMADLRTSADPRAA